MLCQQIGHPPAGPSPPGMQPPGCEARSPGRRPQPEGGAGAGARGPALTGPETGYGAVYHTEILLLFATLVAIGPLVRRTGVPRARPSTSFGLAEFPG